MSDTKSYRELEQDLEAILERVEHASYEELDELLKDYNAGMKLITTLEKKLESAKNTIKKAVK
jgi:exodeoxyribonuclease VII small subunit